jgi:hypothetical protein
MRIEKILSGILKQVKYLEGRIQNNLNKSRGEKSSFSMKQKHSKKK